MRGSLVALGLVYRGMGGGVEDEVRAHGLDDGIDARRIGDVERVDVVTDDLGAGRRGRG